MTLNTLPPVKKKKPFIPSLIRILNRTDLQHIIHWTRDGSKIVIKAVVQLESEVLPVYFDSSRMDSFSRQLNIYGFKRVSDSRKQKNNPLERISIFFNANFHRDKPELLKNITRKKAHRVKPVPALNQAEGQYQLWNFPQPCSDFQSVSDPSSGNYLGPTDTFGYYSQDFQPSMIQSHLNFIPSHHTFDGNEYSLSNPNPLPLHPIITSFTPTYPQWQ